MHSMPRSHFQRVLISAPVLKRVSKCECRDLLGVSNTSLEEDSNEMGVINLHFFKEILMHHL